jgi:hypothetical protein
MPCMENPIAPGAKLNVSSLSAINGGITSFSINSGNMIVSNANTTLGGNISIGGGQIASSVGMNTSRPKPPPSWRQIDVPHDQYLEDVYENPLSGRAVHISSMTLTNGASRHHWKIFRALYPKIDFILIGVSHTEVGNSTVVSNIAFPNPADGLVFEEWLDEYAKPFGDRDNIYRHRYPPLPKRTPPLTAMNLVAEGVNDTDMSLWLAKSCTAPYYVAGRMILFESDEDAVAYTLKFE